MAYLENASRKTRNARRTFDISMPSPIRCTASRIRPSGSHGELRRVPSILHGRPASQRRNSSWILFGSEVRQFVQCRGFGDSRRLTVVLGRKIVLSAGRQEREGPIRTRAGSPSQSPTCQGRIASSGRLAGAFPIPGGTMRRHSRSIPGGR